MVVVVAVNTCTPLVRRTVGELITPSADGPRRKHLAGERSRAIPSLSLYSILNPTFHWRTYSDLAALGNMGDPEIRPGPLAGCQSRKIGPRHIIIDCHHSI
ncbi:Hypothetical protein NTJ_04869 [Nesidiocoris tenuis]|uniref:Uncharacterized protein n=1 Tax=Nesidiocoris tenuis TaxID=355587 RepID=A0ABN7AIG5_9HEMI|nr:Hypothetical protein NTJ_04869 [Nesidiocoris tenuis]